MYISTLNTQFKMERNATEIDEDVEAVVKLAAWAWYERRGASLSSLSTSGSSSQPAGSTKVTHAQEVSIRRRKRSPQPQPSRFMLEAINKTIQQPQPPHAEDKQKQEQDNNKSSCNFSSLQLLDAYEIERISKHLETLLQITSSSTSSGSGVKDLEAANRSSSSSGRCWGGAKQQIMGMASSHSTTTTKATTESAAPATAIMVDTRNDDVKNEETKSRGWFGLMKHNGRICGVDEEDRMVKTVPVQQNRRRKPENHM